MSARPKTVLVVDDDQDIRETVASALADEGYSVTQAANGRDALAQLEAMPEPPGVVLLDMMMPVMTGAEFLAALGAERLAQIPIVVLSAGTAHDAATLGVRKVVRKPFTLDALLGAVSDFGTWS